MFVIEQCLFGIHDIQIAHQPCLVAIHGDPFLGASTGKGACIVLFLNAEIVKRRELIFDLLVSCQHRLFVLRNSGTIGGARLVEVGAGDALP